MLDPIWNRSRPRNRFDQTRRDLRRAAGKLPNAPAPEHRGTPHPRRQWSSSSGTPPSSHTPPPAAAATDATPVLLAVVADKTGYPAEMLELGMDLEADLGIDSIKRVEILAAMRERLPNLPEVDRARGSSARSATRSSSPSGHQPRAPQSARRRHVREARKTTDASEPRCCSPWSPRRPGTRRTCSSWTWSSTRTGHRFDQARRDTLGRSGTSCRRRRWSSRSISGPCRRCGRSRNSCVVRQRSGGREHGAVKAAAAADLLRRSAGEPALLRRVATPIVEAS